MPLQNRSRMRQLVYLALVALGFAVILACLAAARL